MKNKSLCAFLALSLSAALHAQDGDFNMTILAHVPEPSGGSGIWHFVDKNGIEYAAFGANNALIIFSLEDPAKPIERHRVPGVNTIWREVFSYKNHIYGVTDQRADGLIIVDMTDAPAKITSKFWRANITAENGQSGELNTCHTIFIDEKGIMLLNGCSPWQGVLFFDLNKDPNNPEYIGSQTKRYCHDAFMRGDTLYSSDINDGIFSIWDVRDKKRPIELATQRTPHNFNHNSWLSDDGKYLFTTDEVANAYVASYDISDLSNIKLLDVYRPKDTEGTGVVPHNTRYLNGYLITSYYTDGVKIVDAHRPDNLIEVGSVDTYFGNLKGFHGCWGVSPYLPSGTIVASDIEGGLFVIKADYKRACYLEGLTLDSTTNLPIEGVKITVIAQRKNEESSNLKGEFKTGYAEPGHYDVLFTHPSYKPKTIRVELKRGIVNEQIVKLLPKDIVISKVIVRDAHTLQPIENAQVVAVNANRKITDVTNHKGQAILTVIADTFSYDLYAGRWGYLHGQAKLDVQNPTDEIILSLKKGYQDDFLFDFGWSVSSTATTGKWVKGKPNGTFFQGMQMQTEADIPNDYGTECYVTGNTPGNASADDVDNGFTTLSSPEMDLSHYNDPVLSYYTWFINTGGNGIPNDKMVIRISNGLQNFTVQEINRSANRWVHTDGIHLNTLFSPNDKVKLIVDIGDEGEQHLLEGAFDGFLIVDANPVDTKNENDRIFSIRFYPNPMNSSGTLRIVSDIPYSTKTIEILNIFGQSVHSATITEDTLVIGQSWEPGVYFLRVCDERANHKMIKILKL